jgi:hypothetical protein
MLKTHSSKQTATTFGFDDSDFPSLLLNEYGEVWNVITLDELSPREQEGLRRLLEASGILGRPNYRPEVLLVKARDGVFKGVYGPALFRYGDDIVLKVGENMIPVKQSDDRFLVGSLKGKMTVIEKEGKVENYPVATLSFVSPDKSVFKVRVSLNFQLGISAGELEATLLNNESVLPYLAQVPSPAIPMHELGVGEFDILGFSSYAGDTGTRYKLHLANGAVVWSRGNSETLLASGFTKTEGQPLVLAVTHLEEYTTGKFKVDHAIYRRLPRLVGTTADEPEPPTVDTIAETVEDDAGDYALGVDDPVDLDRVPF